MEKKNFCQACHNLKHGVKTRMRVNHTCGKEVVKQEANCPRCAMTCDKTGVRTEHGRTYQNYYCYNCNKPFSILLKGVKFKSLIKKK